MSPEEKARFAIDQKLVQSGWVIQDMQQLNLFIAPGVAVREFPTSTGEVDYALFVDGTPIGIVEAKRTESGEKITTVEDQSARCAGSKLKWVKGDIHRLPEFEIPLPDSVLVPSPGNLVGTLKCA